MIQNAQSDAALSYAQPPPPTDGTEPLPLPEEEPSLTPPVSISPPSSFTLLDAEVDPNGSQAAREAIERGDIRGPNIVLGIFRP